MLNQKCTGNDPYSDFIERIYKYFLVTNIDVHKCTIIKKHSHKLNNNGDISFPLNTASWYGSFQIYNSQNFTDIFQYVSENSDYIASIEHLISLSNTWLLPILKCEEVQHRLNVFFNRPKIFTYILCNIFEEKKCLFFQQKNNKITLLTNIKSNLTHLNLTQLRTKLLHKTSVNILKKIGYDVYTEDTSLVEENNCVHITDNSNIKVKKINVLTGPVMEITRGKKKTDINSEEYYKNRAINMQLMAQHRYGLKINLEDKWKELFCKLGNASITFELLQIKPTSPLFININCASSNSKGISFIMYNCARLAVIQRKFNEKVLNNYYPTLPSVESVNFDLLTQADEWSLLYNYILYYPVILTNCVRSIYKGQINTQYLCSFLSDLCSAFSIYYRNVRILTENRDHLMPVMFARLYLLKALEYVLHNALSVMDIEPVNQM